MSWTGIRIIGFFDDAKSGQTASGQPILGRIADLPFYLDSHPLDYLYIALPFRAQEQINNVLDMTRTRGCQLLLIPDLLAFKMMNVEFQSMGSMVLVNFNPALEQKRYFDILFSLLVLGLSWPLIGLIAVLIKLEDRGPIFFRHQRVTCQGRLFGCLKFRTMFPDAEQKLKELLEADPEARQEWQQTFKLKNDPRITRIGRILRKLSLDELPQFWNVLKGEMSVVGARPVVNRELDEYYKEAGGIYCSIKPGITGLWQVEQRSNTEDYQLRVELDRHYILNRSLLLDLKIVAKTVWKVLKQEGAW